MPFWCRRNIGKQQDYPNHVFMASCAHKLFHFYFALMSFDLDKAPTVFDVFIMSAMLFG